MTYWNWNISIHFLNLSHYSDEPYRCIPAHAQFWQIPSLRFYGSAANPYYHRTCFAVATSHGAVRLDEDQGGWSTTYGVCHSEAQSVIAVDWLSPDVMMKGCNDGGVRLWDVRSNGESREPWIQHTDGINHVRRVDENTIVIAGLGNQVRSLRRGWFLNLLT